MRGIPTDCTRCGLPLDAHNLTGLCRECKHIERDARAGYTAPEATLDEARANFIAAFPGWRKLDASAIYMRGACRRCARFVARRDTGKCEWCSRPTRFKPRRRKSALDRPVPHENPSRGSMDPTPPKGTPA